MRVNIYQPRASYYVGGAEVVALQHAKYLARAGYRVTLFTTKAAFIRPTGYFRSFVRENPAVDIRYISVPKSLAWIYKNPPGQDWERWDLESLHVGRIASSVLESSQTPKSVFAAHNIIDSLALPPTASRVLHLHGHPDALNYVCSLALQDPGLKLMAVSEMIRQKYASMLPVRRGIQVAKNGIDAHHYTILPNRHKKYDLLYVGRLIENKGVQVLIEALSELEKAKHQKLQLAIAGAGPYKAKLQALVKSRKLQAQVNFLGFVPDGQLVRLYNSARLSVLPSLSKEGVLTTMLESCACGTPVLTSDQSSMREFVKNDKNSFLVPAGNAPVLARSIERIFLRGDGYINNVGLLAREQILRQWTWERRIERVGALYESL